MTVTYSLDVSSSSFLCLYKLLLRWKGSIWKSVWVELIIWLACYFSISLTYRLVLSQTQRHLFEELCIFFYAYSEYIPITFMLGFYVSTVFTRWWDIFTNIGWIDSPMLLISCVVRGAEEKPRIIRRNMIRYLVLTQALVFRDVSASVRKRFPTMQHLVTAGLMTEKELKVFDEINSPHAKYWQPMHWVFSLCRFAREEGYISSDIIFVDLLEKMRQYRVNVLNLTLYDWVPVPLVYTQVVHIAVRSFFFIALFSRQYIDPQSIKSPMPNTLDIYVPIMTILQFICFVGWMKVAEVLLNPLGEDDDDFECNWILDRNLQVAFSVVDDAYGKFPTPEKDPWWDEMHPEPLYTAESAARAVNPQVGSCVDMPAEDDHFMVRPHRKTESGVSKMQWDEINEGDIVEVKNDLDRQSHFGSVESLGFSHSFSQPKKGKASFFKKMSQHRLRRDSVSSEATTTAHRRRRRSTASMFAADDAPMPDVHSRHSSIASSLNYFDSSLPTQNGGAYSLQQYLSPTSSVPFQDSLKMNKRDDEGGPKSPTIWCVDENLPSIEEEKRNTDEESQRTVSSKNSIISVILNAEDLRAMQEASGKGRNLILNAKTLANDSGISTDSIPETTKTVDESPKASPQQRIQRSHSDDERVKESERVERNETSQSEGDEREETQRNGSTHVIFPTGKSDDV